MNNNENIKLGEDREGRIVSIDTKEMANSHIAAVGTSGGGKTTKLNDLVRQIVSTGNTSVIYSIHGSHSPDQIQMDNNEYINRIDVSAKGINNDWFQPILYPDCTLEKDWVAIQSILDMIAKPLRLGDNQRACLRKAIEAVYYSTNDEAKNMQAIANNLELIGTKPAISVREKLYPFTVEDIFRDGPSDIKAGKMNIIDLDKFGGDMQITIAQMMNSFIRRQAIGGVYKDNPLFLYVDEFQNMPTGRADILQEFLNEGRKIGINLMLSTQVIKLNSDLMKSMTQSGLLLFFKPAESYALQTAKIIDPINYMDWLITLKSLKVGEFIAVGKILLNGKPYSKPIKVFG